MTELAASFGNGILKVLYDEASAEDAMNTAAAEMDEILAEAAQ